MRAFYNFTMAGLDPATQPPRVGAANNSSSTAQRAKEYLALADARALGGRLEGRPW
jgi:hypothetical protein